MGTRQEKRRTMIVIDLVKMRKNLFALGLKGWSCPRLKGLDPKGYIARAENVLMFGTSKG